MIDLKETYVEDLWLSIIQTLTYLYESNIFCMILLKGIIISLSQSAGAEEYTDCISTEG